MFHKVLSTTEFIRIVGLQFFAAPNDGGGTGDPNTDPNGDPNGGDPNGGQNTNPQSQQQTGEKTFTQAEVTAMATREKQQGRAAVLRELGIDPDDKDAINRYKNVIKESQTKEEQLTTQLNTQTAAATSATARAEAAESKLLAIQKGVTPAFVDDVVVLAMSKVTDDKPLEKVLDEMKTTYPAFFGEEGGNSGVGTGNPANPQRRKNKTESVAERLSKNNGNQAKSTFFTHT